MPTAHFSIRSSRSAPSSSSSSSADSSSPALSSPHEKPVHRSVETDSADRPLLASWLVGLSRLGHVGDVGLGGDGVGGDGVGFTGVVKEIGNE